MGKFPGILYFCALSDRTMNSFEQLQAIIRSRRSVSWSKMNGGIIPDNLVNQVLSLADWAPNHGRTEPWRFFVYNGESMKRFAKDHADLYWNNTAEDKRQEATYEKLLHNVDKASHLVIAVMKRGEKPNIPALEEVAAASAAIQNVLLGATALGLSSFWSSGGMTHKTSLKEYIGLGHDDVVMGLLFFGYTDETIPQGSRNIPFAEKIKWM
jgi:nitroreductase